MKTINKLKKLVISTNWMIPAIIFVLLAMWYASMGLFELQKAQCSNNDSTIIYTITGIDFIHTAGNFMAIGISLAILEIISIAFYFCYKSKFASTLQKYGVATIK